jgi:hypothetical protein
MRRKRLEQSRLDNPNWSKKLLLPELNRLDYNITECFMCFGSKVIRFGDKHLSDGGKCVSYSCNVK